MTNYKEIKFYTYERKTRDNELIERGLNVYIESDTLYSGTDIMEAFNTLNNYLEEEK